MLAERRRAGRAHRASTGRGRRLLELGCGIGLVSLVAAAAGFRVLATDYYADALGIHGRQCPRHGLRGVDTRLVDWRKLPDDLGTFDVVAASDVLYEAPQAGARRRGPGSNARSQRPRIAL